jgi:hypothetical protein
MNQTEEFLKKFDLAISGLNKSHNRIDHVRIVPASNQNDFKEIDDKILKDYYNNIKDDKDTVLSTFLSFTQRCPTAKDTYTKDNCANYFKYNFDTIITVSDEFYAYYEILKLGED